MAVRTTGRGPDVVLFHGGMGSWRHWTRNIDPLSRHFTVHIQAACVRGTRFNSRKVSGGGTLLDDLAHASCRVRVLWGERDDSSFRPGRRVPTSTCTGSRERDTGRRTRAPTRSTGS